MLHIHLNSEGLTGLDVRVQMLRIRTKVQRGNMLMVRIVYEELGSVRRQMAQVVLAYVITLFTGSPAFS